MKHANATVQILFRRLQRIKDKKKANYKWTNGLEQGMVVGGGPPDHSITDGPALYTCTGRQGKQLQDEALDQGLTGKSYGSGVTKQNSGL